MYYLRFLWPRHCDDAVKCRLYLFRTGALRIPPSETSKQMYILNSKISFFFFYYWIPLILGSFKLISEKARKKQECPPLLPVSPPHHIKFWWRYEFASLTTLSYHLNFLVFLHFEHRKILLCRTPWFLFLFFIYSNLRFWNTDWV